MLQDVALVAALVVAEVVEWYLEDVVLDVVAVDVKLLRSTTTLDMLIALTALLAVEPCMLLKVTMLRLKRVLILEILPRRPKSPSLHNRRRCSMAGEGENGDGGDFDAGYGFDDMGYGYQEEYGDYGDY